MSSATGGGKELVCYIGALVVVLWINQSSATSAAEEELERIGSDYWQFKLREFPIYATYRDIHDYDDQLEDYSLEALDNRYNKVRELLNRVQQIDASQLSYTRAQDLAVLTADLSYYCDGYEWRMYGNLNPINFLEGIHKSSNWVTRMLYNTTEDFGKYITRLQLLPKQIDQIMDLMKEAIRLGRTNHNVSMVKVPDQIDQHLGIPANQTVWYRPFRQDVTSVISQQKKEEFAAEVLQIIDTKIIPTIRKLKDFIVNTYMPNTRKEYGVGSFPAGKVYYQACLRFHLSLNTTAEEVRQIGLDEMDRIKGLMEGVMQTHGYHGNLPGFFNYIRENLKTEFYDRSEDELLAEYKNIIYNRINPNLCKVIKEEELPEAVISVHEMSSDGPSGSYGDNIFYVNVRRSTDRPTFTMMALALHEASPGHHLQTNLAKHLDLPEFRRHLWSSKYYAIPFNFPWHTAYTEGWGLYSEYLGEEMGLYNTSALELFGRYSSEILRACRLVVDTGIHAFGMSREEAIEYFANYTAMPRSQIELEVDRYITWPGQACAYKMGELEILRLRNKAEKALGDDFEVRDFNSHVLSVGRVPLEVLQNEIDEWLRQVKMEEEKKMAANSGHHCCHWIPYTLVTSALLALHHTRFLWA